jgi:hypothetical protein
VCSIPRTILFCLCYPTLPHFSRFSRRFLIVLLIRFSRSFSSLLLIRCVLAAVQLLSDPTTLLALSKSVDLFAFRASSNSVVSLSHLSPPSRVAPFSRCSLRFSGLLQFCCVLVALVTPFSRCSLRFSVLLQICCVLVALLTRFSRCCLRFSSLFPHFSGCTSHPLLANPLCPRRTSHPLIELLSSLCRTPQLPTLLALHFSPASRKSVVSFLHFSHTSRVARCGCFLRFVALLTLIHTSRVALFALRTSKTVHTSSMTLCVVCRLLRGLGLGNVAIESPGTSRAVKNLGRQSRHFLPKKTYGRVEKAVKKFSLLTLHSPYG